MFGFFKKKVKSEEPAKMPLPDLKAFFERHIYDKLTRKVINETTDADLPQIVFDNIYAIIGKSGKAEFDAVQRLSQGQQAFFAVWCVEGDVNNGGFNQYYFNSGGAYAELAADGFSLIGASRYAVLMWKANTLFLSIREELEKYNDGTLERFSESYTDNPLNDLDDQFYDLDKIEDLHKLKVDYVRANIEQFI